ncbi:unnamed protein product [Caenorhabditis angaria]|uniref:Nucleotide-diphospho-sugar transferase domain-containing protein n=1 Tax=Caenorhabditis angaria TaxID=860376 RepID=A0A9P1J511_9PELO|nr:unnamed protein product [Caenorhabditis angaria]
MRNPTTLGILILICVIIFLFYFKFSTYDVEVTYRPDNSEIIRAPPPPPIIEKIQNPKFFLPGKREFYPRRENMGDCPPLFGKVTIFVAYVASSMVGHYKVAQESLQCYLKSVNYEVLMIDLDSDERVKKECSNNKQLFFKKHCAASAYLRDTDWMLVLDADTGIANPNHCIEEWIDTRVDIIFYERFFNWEIASGNYLVRNTQFAYNFLSDWGKWEFHQPQNWNGADNGVLQIHILQTLLPHAKQEIKNCDAIWHNSTNYNSYMGYVTCCKLALGAKRLWPGQIRIYRRAHGWVRDGFLTTDRFCERDFMLHGWKNNEVGFKGWESPFKKNLNVSLCGKNLDGWDYREYKNATCESIRLSLSAFEKSSGRNYPAMGRVLPYLMFPDIGDCFPTCDDEE